MTTPWTAGPFSPVFNVRAYGAKGDTRSIADAVMTSGSASLSSVTAGFTVSDIGKRVAVAGAGTGGAPLETSIAAYTSSTVVTLATNASSSVTSAVARYGSDDTAAIQVAMTAASGGTLVFPAGVYLLMAEITGVSNICIVGWGATLTSIRRFRSYLAFTSCSNISIQGLSSDLAMPLLPLYVSGDYPNSYNLACYFTASSNITIIDCSYSNLYTIALNFYSCLGGSITLARLRFTSPAQTQELNLQHIQFVTISSRITLENIDIDNAPYTDPAKGICGITFSGTSGRISLNKICLNFCGRNDHGAHPLQPIAFYADSVDIDAYNIIATNCMWGFLRLANCARVNFANFSVSFSAHATVGFQAISIESGAYTTGSQVGCQDIDIHDFTITESTDTNRIGVAAASYDWGTPCTDVRIWNGVFNGLKTNVLMSGPYKNLRIGPNSSRGVNGGQVLQTLSPSIAITAVLGSEMDSACQDMFVNCGTVDHGANNFTALALEYTTPGHPYSGTVGKIEIDGGTLRTGGAGNTGYGIVVTAPAGGTKGRLTIRNVEIDNFAHAFYVRECQTVTLEQNRTLNILPSAAVTQSGNGNFDQRDNKWTAGASLGRVVLVGGAATVSTTEVLAADNIHLATDVPAGTPGNLWVDSINPGVSFVVKSSNTADNSTVFWEIVH